MLEQMPTPLPKRLRDISISLLAVLATGCISNKAFWQKAMTNKPDSGTRLTMHMVTQKEGFPPPLVLTEDFVRKAMIGTETNGRIRVSYEKRLQPQAALLAPALDQVLDETSRNLGLPLPLQIHLYLLRLLHERRVIHCVLSVPEKERTLPLLMLLTNGPPAGNSASSEALWTDLNDLPIQVSLIAHEACEVHLIDPQELLVMPDPSGSKGFIHITLHYHTRWFRDGFANYTGYQASQCLRRHLTNSGVDPTRLRFCENSMQPFSKLAKVKGKLFDWNQDSKPNLDDDNYEAALGLFLLIEQRKGPGAIADIVHELPKVKFPDGKALLSMIRQKTGLDLRQLAKDFDFPNLGLDTDPDAQGRPEVKNVAAGSWAARVNLCKGDVLVEVNAAPITGLLDLEWQILKALDQGQPVTLTYLRKGERRTTDALKLLPARSIN